MIKRKTREALFEKTALEQRPEEGSRWEPGTGGILGRGNASAKSPGGECAWLVPARRPT